MDIQQIAKKYLSGMLSEKLGNKLGISPSKAQQIVSLALPMITAAMSKNAESAEGKQSLFSAIQKDHDGSIFDMVDTVVENPATAKGDKILGHIFGDQEQEVENKLASQSDISPEQAKTSMQVMAPLLMGALGKEQTDNQLGVDDVMGMFSGSNTGLLSQGMNLMKKFGK